MSAPGQTKEEEQVELFKMKKLIKSLQAARGNGTSMISLVIPPKDQISRVAKMLADEYGAASNIKSRVNLSSEWACSVLWHVHGADGNEKCLSFDFEPFLPIKTSLYMCDNKFHTEPLKELLQDNELFGFIVVDGNGALYGTVAGNSREVLHTFSVDLPNKHRKGGQSAMRFGRIRLEKRQHYVRKVAETATQMFITNDRPNVTNIVLAGSADFKNELNQSDIFDKRLQEIVVKIVDVSYGGERDTSTILTTISWRARSPTSKIAMDSGKYCFGVADTWKALELGAVETLILWEDLPHNRITMRNNQTGEEVHKILSPAEEKVATNFTDAETGETLEVVEKEPLVEWFANNYKQFGTTLEFVTARSQEGSQFCQGFGGIGGILRWQVDFMEMEYEGESDDDLRDYVFI
ncbi:hypothetical protein AeMF1_021612 [Aphanomyces euteiches]|nr:hypothetical protein AeMF1_021612 [Aphanomyces euteiches]